MHSNLHHQQQLGCPRSGHLAKTSVSVHDFLQAVRCCDFTYYIKKKTSSKALVKVLEHF